MSPNSNGAAAAVEEKKAKEEEKKEEKKPLKFLFVSYEGLIGDLAWEVKKEGSEVKYYIRDKSEKDVCDGFVDKCDEWKDCKDWADVIVLDDIGLGPVAEDLRKEGKLVVGGSLYTDRLEDDREFGQDELSKIGVNTLPHWDFLSFDDAIAFVKKNPERYVIKPSGMAQNEKELTFVGQEEDGNDIINVLEHYKKSWSKKISAIQLQKFVQGVEVAVGVFFNGKEFVNPIFINFEHKKLFPGGLGPNCGEMGTMGMWCPPNKLFNETLLKMKEVLAASGYVGYFDLNCCYGYKTNVYTIEGWKQIRDVKVGDLVLTHRGNFKKVTDTIRSSRKEVVEISFNIGRGYTWKQKFTPEHPILTSEGWKLARDLEIKEMVINLATHCKNCGIKIPMYSLWGKNKEREFCSPRCTILFDYKNNPRFDKKIVSQRVRRRNLENSRKHQLFAQTDAGRKFLSEKLKLFHKNHPELHPLKNPKVRLKHRNSMKRIHSDSKYKKEQREIRLRFLELNPEKHPLRILARQGRKTEIERIFEINLRKEGITPKYNYKISPLRYYVDFALPQFKIAIECDGKYFHSSTQQKEHDEKRQEEIEKSGWSVLRFSEDEIRTDVKNCVDQTLRLVKNHNKEYEFMEIEILDIKKYENKYYEPTYNLSVEDDESYIVKGLAVHNCIVNSRGIYPLEFTSRFGYPTISLQIEGITSRWSEFLRSLAAGEATELKTKKGFQICIVVAVPPFPFTDPAAFKRQSEDAIVIFKKPNLDGVHLGDVKLVEDDWRLAGQSGYAVIVTGSGTTLDDASKQAYSRVKNIMIPNMFYRTDIGGKWAQEGDMLYTWGYLY